MKDQLPSFGHIHFGKAELGDKRRTKRLVAIADSLFKNPSGSLPAKFNGPGELEALYHLVKQDSVTHASVFAAQFERTRNILANADDFIVVAHDTTELDYSTHESLTDLGQIGNGGQRGYLCHNSLAVMPKNREVIGLANQVLWKRRKVQKGETKAQRRECKERESQIWKLSAKPLPSSRHIVDVCDRGADIFEHLEAEIASGRTFVIRSKHNRSLRVRDESGKMNYLHDFARTLPSHGTKMFEKHLNISQDKLTNSKQSVKVARLMTLQVSSSIVRIPRPKRRSGAHGNAPLNMYVIRVWEVNPPTDEEALEWILLSNHEAIDLASTSLTACWYECRWVVEEFHKAKKMGLNIQSPQFQSEDRLEPMIALLSVVAISLLNLRSLASHEDTKDRPAKEVTHPDYIEALTLWRYKQYRADITVHDFYMALARLGGHLNRKRDGLPGWITLWRGWMRLNDRVEGARYQKHRLRCA